MSTPQERETAVNVLTELLTWYRAQGHEQSEDTVLTVLDVLVGWCGPHAIPPSWKKPQNEAVRS